MINTIIVFISGPYTEGNQIQNIRAAILAARQLRKLGVLVLVPHLWAFWDLIWPKHYDFWMEMCLGWVPHCDALLRLPGKSQGADDEVAEATALGIPVFYSIHDLSDWIQNNRIPPCRPPLNETTSLNCYKRQVRELTDAKGFSSDKDRVWEMLALIHTEISEATDAYKKGMHLDKIGEELADTIIRIFHLCSALDIDIEQAYRIKMAINWERPHKYNTVRGG